MFMVLTIVKQKGHCTNIFRRVNLKMNSLQKVPILQNKVTLGQCLFN
jgi:hypothetical protein